MNLNLFQSDWYYFVFYLEIVFRMSLIPFLSEVIKIKRTVRTGWKRKNVPEPESVADHMYFMALMALVATPDHLNKDKCIKIAIVHDLAECITGDITPHDGITPGKYTYILNTINF